MMAIETRPWDVTEYLDSPAAIAAYLDAALEEGDAAFFRQALRDVARAKGMSAMAASTGLTREALYKALGENGNPTLDSMTKILAALDLRLSVAV